MPTVRGRYEREQRGEMIVMDTYILGSEIIDVRNGNLYIITKIYGGYVGAISLDGVPVYIDKGDFKPTGKTYPEIERALTAIKKRKEEEGTDGAWIFRGCSLETKEKLVEKWECSKCRYIFKLETGKNESKRYCPKCGKYMVAAKVE